MIIVADTSALISLATCEALSLLEKIFGRVVVPKAVFEECTVAEKSFSVIFSEFLADKIIEISPENDWILPTYLGKGETQALVLYRQIQADYLLLDDWRARKIAQMNNFRVIGSLGTLLTAKEKNLILSILPYLNKLRNSDLFFDDQLLIEVQKLAGE